MTTISVIEFIVYGLITYSSILMLIISTIKEVPTGKTLSIVRAVYFVPGMICASILAGAGVNIVTQTTTNIIKNLNTTETWTESVSQAIVLQNPIWIIVHYMIFIVLLVYVITQVVTLFIKAGKD